MTKLREILIYIGLAMLALFKFHNKAKESGKNEEKHKQTKELLNATNKKNSIRNHARNDSKYLRGLFTKKRNDR
jgi:hypothetical protein